VDAIKILTNLSAVLLLASCGNYLERKSTDGEQNQNLSKESLEFSLVQSKIFNARCVSCHQQYGTYSGVRRELDSIFLAVQSDRMPKTGGPLSDSLKQLLRAWVDAGAPEFAGKTSSPQPVEIQPVWASIYDHIVSSRCLVCHNPNGQAKFLDLSTRQTIFSNRDRVFGDGKKLIDFDDPDQSYLIEVIQDEAEPMPPIWSSIRRLNEDEVNVLKEWIKLGLP